MPTNEEGEFELILGNRQLLSVFFIVVILLGVFFTMGYIVGRNSTPVVTADASAKNAPKPLVVESPSGRDNEPAESTAEKSSTPSSTPVTTAQQRPAETAPAKAKTPPKTEPAKSETPKQEKSANETAKAAPAAAAGGVPSGTYLQLAATTKREADIMVDVLRQKKFTAVDSEIPDKPGLFRVLVGPIGDADVNKTKSDLQSAGFPGDKAIKRSF